MGEEQIQSQKLDTTGKWYGILSRLGIDVRSDGKHGPCPHCGGRDRFRFDDRDGRGTWICNQCGSGDGFGLVKKVFNCSFNEALDMVRPLVDDIPPKIKKEKSGYARQVLNELWLSAFPLKEKDPVWHYLRNRGITINPKNVKYSKSCYEADTMTHMEAMLAMVISPEGKPVTIHRTYIKNGKKADIRAPKKLMPHEGDLKGAAIRLFDPEPKMGIAEGIETALSATLLFGVPVWSAINANMMEQWEPPEEAEQIWIFGDNDESFTGQKVAYALANRLTVEQGKSVQVEIPKTVGDWNDELIRSL